MALAESSGRAADNGACQDRGLPVAELATAGGYVAIRVPTTGRAGHPRAFGRAVVAPSANRRAMYRRPRHAHVAADLNGRISTDRRGRAG